MYQSSQYCSGNVPLTWRKPYLVYVLLHQGVQICQSCCRFRCYLLPNMGRNFYLLRLSSGQTVVLIARFHEFLCYTNFCFSFVIKHFHTEPFSCMTFSMWISIAVDRAAFNSCSFTRKETEPSKRNCCWAWFRLGSRSFRNWVL